MPGYEAVEFTGGGQVRFGPRERPTEPLGANEVEGTTLFSLVSPGTEGAILTKELYAPKVFGYAATFRVDAVGSAVVGIAPGEIVFGLGVHASYQRLDAELVIPVPRGLPPEVAVFARLMGVPWTTLVLTAARPNDSVLVTGLGLVGHLAAKCFAAAGYRVTAYDPDAGRRGLLARSPGIAVIDEVLPSPDDGGYALVMDCSGHEDAVLAGARAARHTGEVALVGAPWHRRSDASAHDLIDVVFHRFLTLRSGWEFALPNSPVRGVPGSIRESLTGALAWLADGRIDVAGLARVTDPADAGNAYAALAAAPADHLTALFDWREHASA